MRGDDQNVKIQEMIQVVKIESFKKYNADMSSVNRKNLILSDLSSLVGQQDGEIVITGRPAAQCTPIAFPDGSATATAVCFDTPAGRVFHIYVASGE